MVSQHQHHRLLSDHVTSLPLLFTTPTHSITQTALSLMSYLSWMITFNYKPKVSLWTLVFVWVYQVSSGLTSSTSSLGHKEHDFTSLLTSFFFFLVMSPFPSLASKYPILKLFIRLPCYCLCIDWWVIPKKNRCVDWLNDFQLGVVSQCNLRVNYRGAVFDSKGVHNFIFDTYWQIAFRKCLTNADSYQKWIRVPVL